MKRQDKPAKKKNPGREPDPSGKNRRAPAAPEATQGSGAKSTPQPVETQAPSKEEVVSNWSKPVTNQDEQDKITNAGEGDIPIAKK